MKKWIPLLTLLLTSAFIIYSCGRKGDLIGLDRGQIDYDNRPPPVQKTISTYSHNPSECFGQDLNSDACLVMGDNVQQCSGGLGYFWAYYYVDQDYYPAAVEVDVIGVNPYLSEGFPYWDIWGLYNGILSGEVKVYFLTFNGQNYGTANASISTNCQFGSSPGYPCLSLGPGVQDFIGLNFEVTINSGNGYEYRFCSRVLNLR